MARTPGALAARLSLLALSLATASACDGLRVDVVGDAMAPTLKGGASAIAARSFDTLDRGDIVGRQAIWAKVLLPDESEQEPRMTVQRVNSADGVPIAYEVHGDGRPALVFVHGWSCDRTYWSGQIEPFSREFTVVAIDLAGHGTSGLDRRSWTMASFGEDVAAVVTELDLQDVLLIGHSMGGDVVPEAARRLPGRVSGLVWVDAYKQLGPGRTAEQVEQFLATFRPDFAGRTSALVRSMFVPASDPALVDRVATDMASAPPDIAIAALESAFSYSREVTRTLAELKLPVVAINPDNAPTDTESMARAGVEVMIMPGVGHFLHMEESERFNALLRVAIDKVRR